MPFNGSGTFVRLENWSNDAANNLPISATKFDIEDNDFAGAFDLCLTRDGQGAPTVPLSWGQRLSLGLLAATGAPTFAVGIGIANQGGMLVGNTPTTNYNANATAGDPPHAFELINDGGTFQTMRICTYLGAGAAVGPNLHFFKARGSLAAPAALQNGDIALSIGMRGYDGTAMTGSTIGIEGVAAENWDASHYGSYLDFQLVPTGGVSGGNRASILQLHSASTANTPTFLSPIAGNTGQIYMPITDSAGTRFGYFGHANTADASVDYQSNANLNIVANNGAQKLQISTSGTITYPTSGTQTFQVTSPGNVSLTPSSGLALSVTAFAGNQAVQLQGASAQTVLAVTGSVAANGTPAISVNSGSAGSPGYGFGTQQTGMWSSATNNVDFSTNGANRLNINASGTVTVNAPAASTTALSVSGVASATALAVSSAGSTAIGITGAATCLSITPQNAGLCANFINNGTAGSFANFGTNYFNTGTAAPVLTANKPGAGTAILGWLAVNLNSTQGWIPVWGN